MKPTTRKSKLKPYADEIFSLWEQGLPEQKIIEFLAVEKNVNINRQILNHFLRKHFAQKRIAQRRRFLLGAYLEHKIEDDSLLSHYVMQELAGFLVDESERKLFGLPQTARVADDDLRPAGLHGIVNKPRIIEAIVSNLIVPGSPPEFVRKIRTVVVKAAAGTP
ncbi:hypothetical protein [Paralysiella testudinis]